MLSDKDIKKFLDENNVWYNFIAKPETVHTADAAALTGIPLEKLTKSLTLLDENKNPVLAIIPGNKKLDYKKLRQALNVKKVRMVAFDDSVNYSGYLPGATPMVNHKLKMRVVLDKSLTSYESIFGGGGARDKILELKTEDVISLNNAIVADITSND